VLVGSGRFDERKGNRERQHRHRALSVRSRAAREADARRVVARSECFAEPRARRVAGEGHRGDAPRARVSVDAIFRVAPRPGSIAPVLGVQVVYDPMAYDFDILPQGVVGHTPSVWAGLSAGISWGMP
jgi:hypothetical protein